MALHDVLSISQVEAHLPYSGGGELLSEIHKVPNPFPSENCFDYYLHPKFLTNHGNL